jgi:hypothetical protein
MNSNSHIFLSSCHRNDSITNLLRPSGTLKNKFGMKKGERNPHTPLQAFCGAKRIKRRALVHWGEWCSAVFPPALTMGDFNLFMAAMCINMVNGQKKSVG